MNLLVILLIVFLLFGGISLPSAGVWNHGYGYGPSGISVIVVIIILFFLFRGRW